MCFRSTTAAVNPFTAAAKNMDVAIYSTHIIDGIERNFPRCGMEIKRYIDKTMFDSIYPIYQSLKVFSNDKCQYIGVEELNAMGKESGDEYREWKMDNNIYTLRNQHRDKTNKSHVGSPISYFVIRNLLDAIEQKLEENRKLDLLTIYVDTSNKKREKITIK
jgi:hypothetical protein